MVLLKGFFLRGVSGLADLESITETLVVVFLDCDVEALSIAVVNVEPMTTNAPRPAKVDPIEPGI
jgi:hypothetical protein